MTCYNNGRNRLLFGKSDDTLPFLSFGRMEKGGKELLNLNDLILKYRVVELATCTTRKHSSTT